VKARKHNGLPSHLLARLDPHRRYLSLCSSTFKYEHFCKSSRKVACPVLSHFPRVFKQVTFPKKRRVTSPLGSRKVFYVNCEIFDVNGDLVLECARIQALCLRICMRLSVWTHEHTQCNIVFLWHVRQVCRVSFLTSQEEGENRACPELPSCARKAVPDKLTFGAVAPQTQHQRTLMCHNRDCFSSRNAIDRHLQATGTMRTTKETGNTGDTVTTAGLFPPHVVAWHAAILDFPGLSCALLAILVFVCRYAAEPPRSSETYIAQPAALPAIEARSPNPRRCGVRVCVGGSVCVCRGC
jgi:hypothetical protein